MNVKVTDRRGQRKPDADAVQDEDRPAPGWWPEMVAVDQELHDATAKHGEPTEQGNTFAVFGAPTWKSGAAEMKRQNDARKAAGKPGQWLKIILEEVYEAFEVEPTADTAADVYAELIQAGAMFIAAAEDLRKQFG